MHVGVCTLVLRLPQNQSLKGKRQVIHSLITRVRHRFNISIAEVGDQDLWQQATLGLSCVSNDTRHAQQLLSGVIRFIEEMRGDVEVIDYQVEML